ncbi:hypothetical protein BT63DRAFT_460039 [Microthyrium microscopicum]|uniref:F-box domain-containing protein n=1 Tax=Microthyrium microscopicum TaxID=703497 RepID=A0A6A6U0A3_9PEZI|nr:hypothetical protein BT63DRAFT_460039 [Microthyrium microscopicum]
MNDAILKMILHTANILGVRDLKSPSSLSLIMSLTSLPGEIKSAIAEHLDGSEDLKPLVREVIIDIFPVKNWIRSLPEKCWNSFGVEYNPAEIWRSAITEMDGFPQVESVFLRFSETTQVRQKVLHSVFESMSKINSITGRKICVLSIGNLQNVDNAEITASEAFKGVLSELEEIHVSICTTTDILSPVDSINHPEVSTFWPLFTQKWLEPVQSNLKALTLHCDEPWDVIPLWQSPNFHSPLLRSLSLGNYIFSSDWQVGWILNHNKLKFLSFDDCLIGQYYEVDPRRDVTDTGLVQVAKAVRQSERRHTKDFRFSPERWMQVKNNSTRLKLNTVRTNNTWNCAFDKRSSNASHFPSLRYVAFDERGALHRANRWDIPTLVPRLQYGTEPPAVEPHGTFSSSPYIRYIDCNDLV